MFCYRHAASWTADPTMLLANRGYHVAEVSAYEREHGWFDHGNFNTTCALAV